MPNIKNTRAERPKNARRYLYFIGNRCRKMTPSTMTTESRCL